MKRPHKFFAIHNIKTNEYLTNQGTWHTTLHRTDTSKVATRFWKNSEAACTYATTLKIDSLEIVDGANECVVSNYVLIVWPNLFLQGFA